MLDLTNETDKIKCGGNLVQLLSFPLKSCPFMSILTESVLIHRLQESRKPHAVPNKHSAKKRSLHPSDTDRGNQFLGRVGQQIEPAQEGFEN